MPFDELSEFKAQRASLSIPEFVRTPPAVHPHRGNLAMFDRAAVFSGPLPSWWSLRRGGVTIDVAGIPPELGAAVEHYGRLLLREIERKRGCLEGSAKGAVAFDRTTKIAYYGASWGGVGWHAANWGTIHPSMLARETVAEASLLGLRSLPPRACAEFKAVNEARLNSACEADLHVWCFRAADMRPVPRCPNCRITVPEFEFHRIWTG